MFFSNSKFQFGLISSLILTMLLILALYCLGHIGNNIFCWGTSLWYLFWAILCWFLFPGRLIMNIIFILVYLMHASLSYFDQTIIGRQGCSLLAMIAALYFFAKILRDWPEKTLATNLPVTVPKRKIPYRLRIIIFLGKNKA